MTGSDDGGPRPPWRAERAVDPNAPLITWRRRARSGGGAAAARETPTDDAALVAPSSVDRSAHDYVRSGRSYMAAYAVLAPPRRLAPTTFGRLARLPGVQMTVVNQPLPRAAVKQRLAELARQLGVSLADEEEQPDADVALRDLRRHLRALAEERTGHHRYAWYLTVAGESLEQLRARERALRDACVDGQVQIVRCDYQHWEGVLTTTALGRDDLRLVREADSPTLARLIPDGGRALPLGEQAPILYGVHADTGAPVILDRFALPSPHQAIVAATGGGKTYVQALLLLQRYAYGRCAIVVMDPKGQEYRALIEETLGGTYLVLSEQAEVRINPLMLPYGDPAALTTVRAQGLDVRMDRAALVKHLLTTEAQARGMPLAPRAEAQLEEAILACYDARGMTHDPATWHADAPTLGEVAARLQARGADEALLGALDLFTTGALGRLINAPGTLPLSVPPSRQRDDVGVLGVDLSRFVQSDDATLQRVLPPLIANYCITTALQRRDRPMEIILDEAWTILGSAAGVRVLETIARIGRSLRTAATVITQQVRDFLVQRTPSGAVVPNAGGMTYLDNCETVLLLRQVRPARHGGDDERNPVLAAAKQFGLTPGEVAWLSQCRRDERGATGLLLAGRTPIPLRIPRAPEPLHTLIVAATGGAAAPPRDAA
jgi:hypothetical protein